MNETTILPQMEKRLLYVIGCPGSGKGTLCKLLEKNYGYHHISVGDLLRDLLAKGDDQSANVAQFVKSGTLVPTNIILDILAGAIEDGYATNGTVVVNGFPRKLDHGVVAEDKWKKPDAVLFLACERSIAEHRYLTRKLEGRLDDDKELFKRRYNEFESLNPPVVDYYENLGLLKQVNTNGETALSYQQLLVVLQLA